MKAVAYKKSLPISDPHVLENVIMDMPKASGRDILVKVEAISVNPVDAKVRLRAEPPEGEVKVLGWDATGTVEDIGDEVQLFKKGDKVWYAGAIERSGANAEYHLVDERIVSLMPKTLNFADAAALPLTSLTAWEILFDRFKINSDSQGTLLVIGGAGGVGSIMIQLAKKLTQLKVVATASRPDTIEWVKKMGADVVINHRNPLSEELAKTDYKSADYVASLTHTDQHLAEIEKLLTPQGHMAVIDDPKTLDIMPFKLKSISIHWELMFTRHLFKTPDMIEQHHILAKVADLVDKGLIQSTKQRHLGVINAENLIRAHQIQESGTAIGKTVLSGFGD
jgi:zinc-binding alcohol dehydrogenase family protein